MEPTITERLAAQRILPGSDIPPHQFLFEWNNIPCFARGELVAITGKAKSGKTYFNSLLMAVAGDQQSDIITQSTHLNTHRYLGLRRIRDDPYRVLWLDTEQSEDSTHEILCHRIAAMIGDLPAPESYAVYNLRAVKWQERFELVKAAILVHQPDLVIFDGIRDVVGDINDYSEAQTVIGDMLSIASFSKAAIVCVLHQNKALEDKTLRGALGTELQNKSFETYECSKDAETRIFSVRQTATRKYDLPNKQQFCLSNDGLPIPCLMAQEDNTPSGRSLNTERQPFNPQFVAENGQIDKQHLFEAVLSERSLTWTELRNRLMQAANIRSHRFAETLISEARDAQLVTTILSDDGRRRYTLLVQPQLFDETS